jgi:hypothetical protein
MAFRLTILMAIVVMPYLAAGPAAQPKSLKDVMQTKLTATRALLEPVIRADFAGVTRQVESLSWISEKEVASWQDVAEPQYTQQAVLFLLAVNGLREAAAKKDTDGVASEYTTLVSSCVQCHAHVSSTRRTALPSMLLLGRLDTDASRIRLHEDP